MPRSMADRRARNGSAPQRPETTVTVYLLEGQHLVRKLEQLNRRRQEIEQEYLRTKRSQASDEDSSEKPSSPRKLSRAAARRSWTSSTGR